MRREEYIESQKSVHGRKTAVVLPISCPKEILTAFNVHAVELWGPPGEARSAEVGRIQTYVCPLVRNALAFIAGGFASQADAVLFPHTCDSIQGLASLLPDFGGWSGAVLRFTHPKGERRKSSEVYLRNEFKDFIGQLEDFTGHKLDEEKLLWAVSLHCEIDALLLELLDKRAYIDASDKEFYASVRRGEWLWPEEYFDELKSLKERIENKPVQTGTPVMLSGIVPEPMNLLDNLNESGAYVVMDDYAAINRRVARLNKFCGGDVLDFLVERYFSIPPCSTRSSSLPERTAHVSELYEKSGAQGLILHNMTFCEPEMYDVPAIKKKFKAMEAPLLYMETALEKELSGQVVTRLEAFVEMASAKKGAVA